MKMEDIIVQYLYHNKSLSLESIGTFTMSNDVVLPAEPEKDFILPANTISFHYDPKAQNDTGLVDFIMQKTRKIRPLAASDLDSFVNLNRQVLNIGKALEIEGLGTLQKTKDGFLEFFQTSHSKIKADIPPVEIKEKINKDISFSSHAPKPNSESKIDKKVFLIPLLGLLVASLAFGAWYLYKNYKPAETPVVLDDSTQAKKADTIAATIPDSSTVSRDTTGAVSNNMGTISNFRLIINSFNNAALAEQRMNKLKSYGHTSLQVFTADSTTYLLIMPFNRSLADTAVVRDSIRKVFPSARLVY